MGEKLPSQESFRLNVLHFQALKDISPTPPNTNMSLIKRDYFSREYIFQTIDFQGTFVSFQSSGSDPLDEKKTSMGKSFYKHTGYFLRESGQ